MTHIFHHPNYYKELRKRNKTGVTAATKRDIGHSQELSFGFPPPVNSDQAISDEASTEATSVRPGPGNKLDVPAPAGPSVKPQAPSDKHQALKLSNQPQASSAKRQASQPE